MKHPNTFLLGSFLTALHSHPLGPVWIGENMWSSGENERGLESHAFLASLCNSLGRRTQTSVSFFTRIWPVPLPQGSPCCRIYKNSISSMADEILTARITFGWAFGNYMTIMTKARMEKCFASNGKPPTSSRRKVDRKWQKWLTPLVANLCACGFVCNVMWCDVT